VIKRRTAKNKAVVAEEVALGKKLFFERGQRSEINGEYLGDEYSHVFASHILSKGAYPAFRLYPKNIVIKSFDQHRAWENSKHKLRGLPQWEWVFKLEEQLRQEYYQLKKI
jgi:hypothetical protein